MHVPKLQSESSRLNGQRLGDLRVVQADSCFFLKIISLMTLISQGMLQCKLDSWTNRSRINFTQVYMIFLGHVCIAPNKF